MKNHSIRSSLSFLMAVILSFSAPLAVLAEETAEPFALFENVETYEEGLYALGEEIAAAQAEEDLEEITWEEPAAEETGILRLNAPAAGAGRDITEKIYWAVKDGALLLGSRPLAGVATGSINGRTHFYPEAKEEDERKLPWEEYKKDITTVIIGSPFDPVTASPSDFVVPYYTSHWFCGLDRLKSVDLSGLDTSYVKDFSFMFDGCTELSDAADAGLLAMDAATTLEGMFRDCTRLKEIDISALNTAKVTSMKDMFLNCCDLEKVVLGEISTAKVETMEAMFSGCESLKEADISKLDTSFVNTFEGMFRNCRELAAADLSNLNTQKATNMKEMFLNCENIRYFDLSGEHFDTQYAEEGMTDMFTGCVRLEKVKVNENCKLRLASLPAPSEKYIPGAENVWYSAKESRDPYDPKLIPDNKADTYTAVYDYWSALWQKADKTPLASVSNVPRPKNRDLVPEYPGTVPTEEPPAAGKVSVFTGWKKEISSGMKQYTFTALFETRDVDDVRIQWLNYDDTQLASASVVYGETPVYGGSTPERPGEGGSTFTFSGWDPEVVPALKDETYRAVFDEHKEAGVFWGYDAAEKKLYLSSGKTENIENAADSGQFSGNTVFATASDVPWNRYAGKVSAVVTEKANGVKIAPASVAFWFAGMKDASAVSLEAVDTSNTVTFRRMFAGCSMLEQIDGTALSVTEKAEDLSEMFLDCLRLKEIPGFAPDTKNVKDFHGMFSGCSYLQELDVSGFRTGEATDLSGMFRGCERLSVIDLSGFSTGKAEDMREMLYGCRSVTTFDFTGFDTSKCLAKMKNMLAGCTSLGGFVTGTKCVLSADTGLPGPSPDLYEGADGKYWFDGNNDGFTPDKIHAGGTYRPVYGQVTYVINYSGRTGTVVDQLNFGSSYYSLKTNPFFIAEDVGFVSWNTKADGTGDNYLDTDTAYKDGMTPQGYNEKYKISTLLGKTLYATWKKIIVNTAEVYWRNTDEAQTVLQYDKAVPYGDTPVYTGKKPTKDPDGYFYYEFDKWTDAEGNVPGPVSGKTTYFARYSTTDRYYDVVWYNFDGTIMRKDTQLKAGTLPVYRGIAPIKTEDYDFTYEFTGWADADGHAPEALTANKNYVAQFKAVPKKHDAKYEVQWLNYDNTLLKKELLLEGTKPKYEGRPERPSTPEYDYSFKGWDPAIPDKIMTNMIFKAQYITRDRTYTVWYDSNGHGSDPAAIQLKPGDSIPRPKDPVAEGYDFVCWCLKNDGTQPFDFDTELMPYANLTLYASWKKHDSGGGGGGGGGGGTPGKVPTIAINKGATYSKYWFLNAAGDWMINDGKGQLITSAWLCDDLVSVNRPDIWYLIGEDGRMLDAGLVRDNSGNYYSLEMRHNGYYGMLRYQSGMYDGIYLEFETGHNGSFGAIKNQEGIDALKARYGITYYNIGNERCLYTSTFDKK